MDVGVNDEWHRCFAEAQVNIPALDFCTLYFVYIKWLYKLETYMYVYIRIYTYIYVSKPVYTCRCECE
jgi:hypothetical protein